MSRTDVDLPMRTFKKIYVFYISGKPVSGFEPGTGGFTSLISRSWGTQTTSTLSTLFSCATFHNIHCYIKEILVHLTLKVGEEHPFSAIIFMIKDA